MRSLQVLFITLDPNGTAWTTLAVVPSFDMPFWGCMVTAATATAKLCVSYEKQFNKNGAIRWSFRWHLFDRYQSRPLLLSLISKKRISGPDIICAVYRSIKYRLKKYSANRLTRKYLPFLRINTHVEASLLNFDTCKLIKRARTSWKLLPLSVPVFGCHFCTYNFLQLGRNQLILMIIHNIPWWARKLP